MKTFTKRSYRVLTIWSMVIAIIAITVYVVLEVGKVVELPYPSNLGKGLMAWLKGVILSQAILLIGGLFLFMLRNSKRSDLAQNIGESASQKK